MTENLKKSLKDSMLEDLARSGLDSGDAKKLRLEVLDRDETDDLVGEPRASYKIPYFTIEGEVSRYTRVRFLETAKKKRFAKNARGSMRYSQPAGSSPHVYFPPYVNWRKIVKDPGTKITITEGEKKAALACKLGIPTIALGGVYAFKSKKRFWELIPDLEKIEWKSRVVEICYDSDVMWKAEVRQALAALSHILSQEKGVATVNFVFLDYETADDKLGLDDFLVANGVEEYEKLERQPYGPDEKIHDLNQRICYVEKHGAFFNLETKKFYRNLGHLREAFMNEGEVVVDKSRTTLVIDLWARSKKRATVSDIIYSPGEPEMIETTRSLNLWRPSSVAPVKGVPQRWLDLVHFIMRKPEYADWFIKWLAYPLQNPGAKLLSAVFVYGEKQGVGKTFTVDPVMEFIYGRDNFHRLQNNEVTSVYNPYAGNRQFIVTNEIYLPEYKDRRSAMSTLKDMITRERVTVNEKYQPQMTYDDHCNYYFTSNHADALILERGDRRFFVIEAPDKKLPQSDYDELDEWVRGAGAGVILHYLRNRVDCSEFNPKADALKTEWKSQLVDLSKDALGEFVDRLAEDPEPLFLMNGELPDLELYRADDIVRLFEMQYPRYRFNVTVNRMARLLNDGRIERRKVRLSATSRMQVLYAMFQRESWKEKKNRDWAEHYVGHAKRYGGSTRRH